jgi:hypothetical protein
MGEPTAPQRRRCRSHLRIRAQIPVSPRRRHADGLNKPSRGPIRAVYAHRDHTRLQILRVQRIIVQPPVEEEERLPSFGPPDIAKLLANNDTSGLILALAYRKDPRIRRDAARALALVVDSAALEPLVAALKDDN